MKTILKSLPMLAIVVGIAASAFTSAERTGSKLSGKKSYRLTAYSYWYRTQAGGTQVGTLFYSNPSNPVDKDNLADKPEICEDNVLPVCMVGSDIPLTTGASLPAASGPGNPSNPNDADNRILFTE